MVVIDITVVNTATMGPATISMAGRTLPGQNRSSKFVLNQPAKMKSKSNNSNYKKYGHNYKLGQRRHGADPISHIVQEIGRQINTFRHIAKH